LSVFFISLVSLFLIFVTGPTQAGQRGRLACRASAGGLPGVAGRPRAAVLRLAAGGSVIEPPPGAETGLACIKGCKKMKKNPLKVVKVFVISFYKSNAYADLLTILRTIF